MSYCRQEGKDEIIFLTKEDFTSDTEPSTSSPPSPPQVEEEEPAGLILPDGQINWDCPCLQGMGSGPCGQDFKDAFSCFHYSESEPKGTDCLEQFKGMQDCFMQHPEVYGSLEDDEEDGSSSKMIEDIEAKEVHPVSEDSTANVTEASVEVVETSLETETSQPVEQEV